MLNTFFKAVLSELVTVIVAVLSVVSGLEEAVMVIVPLPVAEAGVTVTQSALLAAVHLPVQVTLLAIGVAGTASKTTLSVDESKLYAP